MNTNCDKRQFIDEQLASGSFNPYSVNAIFKRVEEYEEVYGKDLSDFTPEQIKMMYKAYGYTVFESLKVANSWYKKYTDWCGKADNNAFATFREPELAKLVNNDEAIVSEKKIIQWCRELPNPSDRFLLLGLFEGIKGENFADFVNLTVYDLYPQEGKIYIQGRGKLPFSGRLIGYGLESADTLEYASITGKMKKKGKFIESDLVIKEYAAGQETAQDFFKGRRIYRKLLRILGFVYGGTQLTATSISDSGIIAMINKRKGILCVTSQDYLNRYIDEVELQYGRNISPSTFYRKYEKYLG